MMNMSKSKNNMKKKVALLGSLITASGLSAEAATKNYDISIPMMKEHSIFHPKPKETVSSTTLYSKAFEYIYKKRLLTMNLTIPVNILTDSAQKLNQEELILLSGGAECKLRTLCAKYLEVSSLLNMDKLMDVSTKHKERMRNATVLRHSLAHAFSASGRKEVCARLNDIIAVIDRLLETQKEEVNAYYEKENKKN